MHEVVVLLAGYSRWTREGKQRAGGTVTLIKGAPNVLVDTGAPEQRQQLLDALAADRVDASEVAFVVLTHGHLDHIGNNNLFPNATFVLESDIGRDGEYWLHDFDRAPFLIETTDGGPPVEIIVTRGHTDHDVSVLVQTTAGTVAVVGDLFGHDRDWVDEIWREFTTNEARQRKSREMILQRADFIVPGHGTMFKVPGQLAPRGPA